MNPPTLRRLVLGVAAALWTLPALAAGPDLSPEQPGRARADKVPEAIALLPKDHAFVHPGKLTVASNAWQLPFTDFATDNLTLIGAEPDIAQLVADSLGLELELVSVAWADWPLGVSSGKYDAVISNVTVTEERKEKFDFSSYRRDLLGFYAPADSKVAPINGPKDVAGLKIIVGSGTNQEQILLKWLVENEAAGLPRTELVYLEDDAARDLTLLAGRVDAYFGPNAPEAYKNSIRHDRKLLGSFSGGYPVTADIAVTTRKGSGLAEAITAALNAQIKAGTYQKVLTRWGIDSEAVPQAETNPPGLPKE